MNNIWGPLIEQYSADNNRSNKVKALGISLRKKYIGDLTFQYNCFVFSQRKGTPHLYAWH